MKDIFPGMDIRDDFFYRLTEKASEVAWNRGMDLEWTQRINACASLEKLDYLFVDMIFAGIHIEAVILTKDWIVGELENHRFVTDIVEGIIDVDKTAAV